MRLLGDERDVRRDCPAQASSVSRRLLAAPDALIIFRDLIRRRTGVRAMTAVWHVVRWGCVALAVAIAALMYPPLGERIRADIRDLSPDTLFKVIVIVAIAEAFSESRRRRRENLELFNDLAEDRKQTAATAAKATEQTN